MALYLETYMSPTLEHDADYHKGMNAAVFEWWFKEELLPHILKYHCYRKCIISLKEIKTLIQLVNGRRVTKVAKTETYVLLWISAEKRVVEVGEACS